MSDRRDRDSRPPGTSALLLAGSRGFTLVELIVVAAILGVLAIMVVPAYDHLARGVKISRCAVEIRGLEKAITAYLIDRNAFPNSLNDLNQGNFLDPWRRPYQYQNGGGQRKSAFLTDLNSDFDLYSMGQDGLTVPKVSEPVSMDDIVRAGDGGFVGLGSDF